MQDVTKTPEWKFLTEQAKQHRETTSKQTLIIGNTVIHEDGKTTKLKPVKEPVNIG